MTNVIEELFNSPFYEDYDKSPELKALVKKEVELWDQLKPTIGLETIDEIQNIRADIAHEIELKCFRQGIRLGASLMLELMN